MKKRVFLSLVCSFLFIGMLGGCSSEKEEGNTDKDIPTEEEKTPEKSELLVDTYKCPGRNIYIDTPNYQEIEEGYTRVFVMHDIKMVTINVNKRGDTSSLEKAHETAFENMRLSTQNYCYPNYLTVEKDSIENINGMEVYKYEGTINCGHDTIYEAYAVGYSFILDGEPCNINGMVLDKEQPEELKKEMKEVVDAMIYTVRCEK